MSNGKNQNGFQNDDDDAQGKHAWCYDNDGCKSRWTLQGVSRN